MGWQHPQKSCESLPIAPPELITSHPHACQVPICVSPALGPPLMTCCSSFMKCSLEQFYTSFDLCSGMHPPPHTHTPIPLEGCACYLHILAFPEPGFYVGLLKGL